MNELQKPQILAVKYRLPLLFLGFISLLFGMAGGLFRLGWPVSFISVEIIASHDALMVGGFLGTLISLERAVAFRQKWAYLAPLISAISALVIIFGGWLLLASVLMCIASLLLSLVTFMTMRHRPFTLYQLILLLGALSWCLASCLWLAGFSSVQLVPWWLGFLLFTIAGERLELSQVLPQSIKINSLFVFFVALYLIGGLGTTLAARWGMPLLSIALFLQTLCLLKNDIARYSIKQQGLIRYIGCCVLLGYMWLLTAGILGMAPIFTQSTISYDAFIHAIVIGFVFSMIFAHAPIIFPAIVKIRLPYHSFFYTSLIILNLSLLIRIYGDLTAMSALSRMGGILNVLAIAFFVVTMLFAAFRGRQ